MTTQPPLLRVSACLRAAATEAERQAAITAWLRSPAAAGASGRRAVLVEGALLDRSGPQDVPLIGLGAGCPCCTGSVSLRVALGRTLRRVRPEAVLLLLATAEHMPRLRRILEDGALGVHFDLEA